MPASVSLQDVVEELKGLDGMYPLIEYDGKNFRCRTELRITGGRRGGAVSVIGRSDSADRAILLAYQSIHEIPEGRWLESAYTGRRWDFDPETEGWITREPEAF